MSQRTEQKDRSRAAILESAAALLRQRGIRASSVLDVMKGASLTVGGFYGHFESKEALFAETIQKAAHTTWDRLIESASGDTGAEKLIDIVRKYVSRAHRDEPEAGCLLPSAVPDASREDGAPYRAALSEEVGRLAKSLSTLAGGEVAKERALGLIALMYGALALSRGLRGTPLSDEILVAARKLAERAIR